MSGKHVWKAIYQVMFFFWFSVVVSGCTVASGSCFWLTLLEPDLDFACCSPTFLRVWSFVLWVAICVSCQLQQEWPFLFGIGTIMKLISQNTTWLLLVGPALYAFNDAAFTEDDWQGIQRAGRSIKHDDPSKVGRFGIGFNSVYHVTGKWSAFFAMFVN